MKRLSLMTLCLPALVATMWLSAQEPATPEPPADKGAAEGTTPRRRPGVHRRRPMQAGGDAPRLGEGFARGREGLGGMPAFLERLRLEAPETFERLSKLYHEDRQAFMREAKDMALARGMKRGRSGPGRVPEEAQCAALSKLYHETEDETKKGEVKKQLEKAIAEAFEARMASSRQRITRLEKQLAAFRENIARLEKNREGICRARLDELTREPELKWEANW